ncbi:MAG TPA: hypothetical protein VHM19_15165, partial [Polyangiales bacterium]|nr:hypothetical protein [Polyangiales bacterium]
MTSQLFIVVCSVCSLVLVTATAWMTWKLSIALRRMRLAHADTWAPEPPRRRRRTASELARDAEQFYACLLNEDP